LNYADIKPGIQYGQFNAYEIDTTPGVKCWASPSEPVERYTHWLRTQYGFNRVFADRFDGAAMTFARGGSIDFNGPHVQELKDALTKITANQTQARLKKKKRKDSR